MVWRLGEGRIAKLKASKPVTADFKNEFELNADAARECLLDNLRNSYANTDTGETIIIDRQGARKVTSHSRFSEAHLKSVVAILEMIRKAIFITEEPNTKGNKKYDTYKYYVCGLKIDGVDYTAKVVIGVKGDEQYYDHKLTEIEKGTLLDSLDNQSSILKAKPLSDVYDSKLLQILQDNSSKVLDENGEPLVVYHGTDAKFDTFDSTKGRVNMDIVEVFAGKKCQSKNNVERQAVWSSCWETQPSKYVQNRRRCSFHYCGHSTTKRGGCQGIL